MKNFLLKFLIMNLFVILSVLDVYAQDPVLYFSDITSGPATGLGDGKGSGAIVTVWGANLGSSQATSAIQIGGVKAAYVYYWGNADGSKLAGPAVLYNPYQKIQTISFSVPATSPNGLTSISVTVGGVNSNTLPFTVRSGRICFVSPSGVDSPSNCAYGSPWKTLNYMAGGSAKLQAGDIIYAMDGITEAGLVLYHLTMGTQANPMSLIAYPGALVSLVNSGGYGITTFNSAPLSTWWNFSKLVAKSTGDGIDVMVGSRIIANEISNYPGGCATGNSGAIAGNNLGGPVTAVDYNFAFGNYIHDFGCLATSKLHHVFYISNRSGSPAHSPEIGWNYLVNNFAYGALHNYDEGVCGDWIGPMYEHDNVVINQEAEGIGVAGNPNSGVCWSVPMYFYNNLFINTGRDLTLGRPTAAVGIGGTGLSSHIYIWNNTFYGYGQSSTDGALMETDGNATYTVDFRNNIVVDTLGAPFNDSYNHVPPNPATNNVFYSLHGVLPPSWAQAPIITSNPLLVNPVVGGYYNLLSTSPARNAGTSVVNSIVIKDILGTSRPPGPGYDIGAYQYFSSVAPSAPMALTVK